jgi:phage tail-like protein
MGVDKSAIKSGYPLPAYSYRVTVLKGQQALVLSFAEVSGLNIQYEPVTYKHGLSFAMGVSIIPGMRQPTRLTMKRGIVKSNAYLYEWLHGAYTDPFATDAKRDILIDLCDESAAAVIRWSVQGALPIRLDAPTFDANTNEVAIETMEFIAHSLRLDYSPGK